MTVAERVAELLAGVPIEEQLRGREVEEGARFLGLAEASTYRLIAQGRLEHVKLEGGRRRGHGCAGAVRVRLIDLIRFQVLNERVPGAGPIGKEKRPRADGRARCMKVEEKPAQQLADEDQVAESVR